MVKIFCVNTQTSMMFPEGTTLMDMLPAFEFEKPYPILSAKVNNVSQGTQIPGIQQQAGGISGLYIVSGKKCILQFIVLSSVQGCKGCFP